MHKFSSNTIRSEDRLALYTEMRRVKAIIMLLDTGSKVHYYTSNVNAQSLSVNYWSHDLH